MERSSQHVTYIAPNSKNLIPYGRSLARAALMSVVDPYEYLRRNQAAKLKFFKKPPPPPSPSQERLF